MILLRTDKGKLQPQTKRKKTEKIKKQNRTYPTDEQKKRVLTTPEADD